MCLYFNFVNLGAHALSQAATWFVPIAVRHEMCVAAEGGWSRMLAMFLRRLFLDATGFATAGLPLMIHGAPVLVFARLGVCISDGDGLRLAYCWKGASSLHPCLRHFNVLKKNSDLAGRVRGYCEITEDDPSKFQCTSVEKVPRHLRQDCRTPRAWRPRRLIERRTIAFACQRLSLIHI